MAAELFEISKRVPNNVEFLIGILHPYPSNTSPMMLKAVYHVKE